MVEYILYALLCNENEEEQYITVRNDRYKITIFKVKPYSDFFLKLCGERYHIVYCDMALNVTDEDSVNQFIKTAAQFGKREFYFI